MQNLSVKKNQIFQLGDHILACGDCTDRNFVSNALGGKKISLILTDPPYGVSYVESKANFGMKTSNSNIILNDSIKNEDEYTSFSENWLASVVDKLTSKNAYYIFNCDVMLFALHEALINQGFKFSQLLIWIKNQAILGRKDYMPQHELIVYGWYGTHEFRKSKDKSILLCPKPTKSKLHPTMKPVSVLRRLILNSSNIADYVYDPFAGSGSTLMACEQTKRKCISLELDPKYCKTVITRWEKLTGEKHKLL